MSLWWVLAGIDYKLCLLCCLHVRDVDSVKAHVKRTVDGVEVYSAHADGTVSSRTMNSTDDVHAVAVCEGIMLIIDNHTVQTASGKPVHQRQIGSIFHFPAGIKDQRIFRSRSIQKQASVDLGNRHAVFLRRKI